MQHLFQLCIFMFNILLNINATNWYFIQFPFVTTLVSFYELFVDVFSWKKRKTRTTQELQNGQCGKVEEKKLSRIYILLW